MNKKMLFFMLLCTSGFTHFNTRAGKTLYSLDDLYNQDFTQLSTYKWAGMYHGHIMEYFNSIEKKEPQSLLNHQFQINKNKICEVQRNSGEYFDLNPMKPYILTIWIRDNGLLSRNDVRLKSFETNLDELTALYKNFKIPSDVTTELQEKQLERFKNMLQ